MQLLLNDLLREEHIATDLQVENAEQAIRRLSRLLEETRQVEPAFADEVCKRERVFPTGLPTEPFPVAIPHADPDYVRQSGLAIGVLARPVTFHQMGADASKQLAVRLVFLLAMHEAEKQVTLLRELVSVLQNPSLLKALVDTRSPKQALQELSNHLASS